MKTLKLSVLTLSLLTPFCTFSANVYMTENSSFDVFGRVQVLVMNGDGAYPDYPSPNTAGDNSIVATTRFGIAGRTKLTHGLDAIMMGEWDMPSTTSGRTHNRYLYVGIDAYQYGSLTAGTGDGAFYTVAGATDIYHYLKTRANDYFVMGDQLPGQIMYSLSGLGWDLRISYQTANEYINDTPFSIRNAAGIAISGKLTPKITIAYGIDYYDLTYQGGQSSIAMDNYFSPMLKNDYNLSDAQIKDFSKNHRPGHKYDYGVALSYGFLGEGLYGAFVFTGTDYEYLKHQIYTYDLALNYSFANGIGIAGGYSLQTYNGDATVSDLNLSLYYKINPSFKVFAEAQIDLNADPLKLYGENAVQYEAQDKFVLGAEYDF